MAWIKQYRIILIISFVLATLVVQLGLFHSLLLFLLVGVIPGTNYSVPPLLMVCGALALAWLVIISVTYPIGRNQRSEPTAETKPSHLPRRRYAR